MPTPDRRDFLKQSAALLALGGAHAIAGGPPLNKTPAEFTAFQAQRRKELWSLLGDLPWDHKPGPATLLATEKHDGFTLERLVLDLNGIEPVPALLLIPDKRQARAPGLLYIHWHAGMYDLGKEQLLTGVDAQPAYAPVCTEKGLVTLAIDSWCFGERKHDENGSVGEESAFKYMIWNGQVLYGMMMFDEFRALDYLAAGRKLTLAAWACWACPWVQPRRGGWRPSSRGCASAWTSAALRITRSSSSFTVFLVMGSTISCPRSSSISRRNRLMNSSCRGLT